MVERAQSLADALFAEQSLRTFAVLDGASISELMPRLYKCSPKHVCLYRGELPPDVAACAPYLVALEPDAPFTTWILDNGWLQHWGVFAQAPYEVTFRDLRKHFRTFLMVKNSEGKSVYFRYYDPRVLCAFLPSCSAKELNQLFGPLSAYLVERADDQALIQFTNVDGQLKEHVAFQADVEATEGV